MTGTPQPASPENVGRICQIIAAALMLGVICFSFVAFTVAKNPPATMPIISMVGAGFAGIATIVRFVLPQIMVAGMTRNLKPDEPGILHRLASLYQTKMIIGMAVLEGAAFFNLVGYIVERQIWSYGVVAALLTIMAISFPSQTQFENWAEDIKRGCM